MSGMSSEIKSSTSSLSSNESSMSQLSDSFIVQMTPCNATMLIFVAHIGIKFLLTIKKKVKLIVVKLNVQPANKRLTRQFEMFLYIHKTPNLTHINAFSLF